MFGRVEHYKTCGWTTTEGRGEYRQAEHVRKSLMPFRTAECRDSCRIITTDAVSWVGDSEAFAGSAALVVAKAHLGQVMGPVSTLQYLCTLSTILSLY